MDSKPQETSATHTFDLEVKQPNKTKKVILLNNGFINNDNRASNDHDGHCDFNIFDGIPKGKLQLYDSSLNQKTAIAPNDRKTYRNVFLKHNNINLFNIVPHYDRKINYNKLFWKMYLENEIVVSEMKRCVTKAKEVQASINDLEQECQEIEKNLLSNSKKETKKKNRRTANEIQKTFLCPYQNCNKNYGSDVSLNLHIKLKHNGGNKTEREKLARTIFLAKMNGEEVPEMKLNLPPGFLENMNKSKLMKEMVGKKERSVAKENEQGISNEATDLEKAESLEKPGNEESGERQFSSDSQSVETQSEPHQKQNDFQSFSTKPVNLIPSLITTK